MATAIIPSRRASLQHYDVKPANNAGPYRFTFKAMQYGKPVSVTVHNVATEKAARSIASKLSFTL